MHVLGFAAAQSPMPLICTRFAHHPMFDILFPTRQHVALYSLQASACRGAFNSFLVRNSFDHAYNMLTAPNFDRGRPILGMILRLNEVLAIRPPPA